MDCIFCKIARGGIASNKVYEDNKILAFNDLDPKAPVHVLIIPKEHISSINGINSGNSGLISHIFEIIPKLADELGLDEGYRVVSNCLEYGGQSVDHLHFHLLGGRKMTWPPG